MSRISRHFTMNEVCKSSVATRKGISNRLPIQYVESAEALALEVLEVVRQDFGRVIVPNSWYRSEELNDFIGGSKTSQHCLGEAVDFEIAGVDNFEVACYIADNLVFDQLILEYYNENEINSGWIHVSYTLGHNRGQVFRFDGDSYTKGLTDVD